MAFTPRSVFTDVYDYFQPGLKGLDDDYKKKRENQIILGVILVFVGLLTPPVGWGLAAVGVGTFNNFPFLSQIGAAIPGGVAGALSTIPWAAKGIYNGIKDGIKGYIDR